MNYLAHLYLADANPESLIGNLMGDFAKGPIDQHLSPAIRQGIALHRKIDVFTNVHPLFTRSRQRIRPPFHRYSGILVDIFYDHLLARDWAQYSPLSLVCFSRTVYRILIAHYDNLPPLMRRSVSYIIANDLLLSYREVAGIERALRGIEGRLKRPSRLGEAVAELSDNYASLATDFAAFFPELTAYVFQEKALLAGPVHREPWRQSVAE